MKQKVISTGAGRILLIEMEEGVSNVQIWSKPEGKPYRQYFHIRYDLPGGWVGGFALFYKDFGGKKKYPKDLELLGSLTEAPEDRWANILGQPIGSILSCNEILFTNPVKHPKEMKMQPASFSWYKNQVKLHEKAHAKVWDIKRTYIFKIN